MFAHFSFFVRYCSNRTSRAQNGGSRFVRCTGTARFRHSFYGLFQIWALQTSPILSLPTIGRRPQPRRTRCSTTDRTPVRSALSSRVFFFCLLACSLAAARIFVYSTPQHYRVELPTTPDDEEGRRHHQDRVHETSV